MANLTDRQRNLLQVVNQLNQNLLSTEQEKQQTTTSDAGINKNVSVDLPGIDLDAGFNLNGSETPTQPSEPQTMQDILLKLRNEQVEITTPFGPVTGTLISVQNDYVVLIENDGSTNLVPIDKIEQVSHL